MRARLETTGSTDSSGTDLISLEDLKLELNVTDDSEDALLTARIARWSKMFADECRRTFAFAEGVETFTFDSDEFWPPQRPLVLSLYPIVDIVSVTQNGSSVDYDLDATNGLLWLQSGCWSGTVVVTYSGGYVLPSEAPSGLVEAIITQLSDLRSTPDDDLSIRSITHGDVNIQYNQVRSGAGSMSQTVMDLLAPYKRPVIA